MNDDELRLLIRAAIRSAVSGEASEERGQNAPVRRDADPVSVSFGQYRLERAPGDTTCIIEPAVACNHCGFCKCHGH